LAGVTAVRVNLESKDVEIDATDVTWEQISSAIDEAGFEAVAK
jgi:copper chaperone CopZ